MDVHAADLQAALKIEARRRGAVRRRIRRIRLSLMTLLLVGSSAAASRNAHRGNASQGIAPAEGIARKAP